MRSKHDIRCPTRAYVAGSVCPICETDFGQRVRCLKHLGDARRPCRAKLLQSSLSMLPPDEVKRLDAIDNECRKRWRKEGHTQVLATTPAVNKQGKVVGRCTR
eukprot:3329553-Karenia_brevis.AAC.1